MKLSGPLECVLRTPSNSLGARGEAVDGDTGKAFIRDEEVCPRPGGWRLPGDFLFRAPASQFLLSSSEGQTFTRDPESWRIAPEP